MTRNERIARALGLDKGCMGFGEYDTVDGRQVGTGRYNIKLVRKYLRSPDGQRSVHNRVRELWRDYPGEYGCRNAVTSVDVNDGAASIELVNFDHSCHSADIYEAPESFDAGSESEANEEALLWLYDKEGGR